MRYEVVSNKDLPMTESAKELSLRLTAPSTAESVHRGIEDRVDLLARIRFSRLGNRHMTMAPFGLIEERE